MEDTFDFGEALKRLKSGVRCARLGWNGKGMHVALYKGFPDGISTDSNTAQVTGQPEGLVCRFLPHLMMKTADTFPTFVPWLASQTDMLAEDWVEAA